MTSGAVAADNSADLVTGVNNTRGGGICTGSTGNRASLSITGYLLASFIIRQRNENCSHLSNNYVYYYNANI